LVCLLKKKYFLAVFYILLVLVMLPQIIPKESFPESIFLSLCSIILLVFSVLQLNTHDKNNIRFSIISVFLLLFYGWGAVGYFYTGSLDVSYSLVVEYLGVISLYIGLIFYFKNVVELYRFIWVVVCCAGVQALIVVSQKLSLGSYLLAFQGKSFTVSSFLYPTIFGSYILLVLPLIIFLRHYSIRRSHKIFSDFLFVLLMVSLLISGSKISWVGTIFQLIIISFYFLGRKDITSLKNMAVVIFISLTTYSVSNLFLEKGVDGFTAFFGVKSYVELGSKKQSFTQNDNNIGVIDQSSNSFIKNDTNIPIIDQSSNSFVQDEKFNNLKIRLYYWKSAWEIIKDNFIKGTGPNTFSLIAPLYLFDIKYQQSFVTKSSSVMNPSSAHSFYFQTASDLGIVGLGLFLVMICFVYFKSFYLFREIDRPAHNLNFYVIVSLTGYLFHNLFEFNWYPSEFIYTFTILIFIVDLSTRDYLFKSSDSEIIYSRCLSVFVWCVILTSFVVTLNYYFYLKTFKPDGVFLYKKSTDWDKNIERAKVMCPRCSEPFLIKGQDLLSKYNISLNPVLLSDARFEFDKAIQNNPLDLRSIPFLIKLLSLEGEFDRAKKYCYKLLKFQKFELIGRMQLAIIILVESNVARNFISGEGKNLEAWERAREMVVNRFERFEHLKRLRKCNNKPLVKKCLDQCLENPDIIKCVE
jgi:hypothetical protein